MSVEINNTKRVGEINSAVVFLKIRKAQQQLNSRIIATRKQSIAEQARVEIQQIEPIFSLEDRPVCLSIGKIGHRMKSNCFAWQIDLIEWSFLFSIHRLVLFSNSLTFSLKIKHLRLEESLYRGLRKGEKADFWDCKSQSPNAILKIPGVQSQSWSTNKIFGVRWGHRVQTNSNSSRRCESIEHDWKIKLCRKKPHSRSLNAYRTIFCRRHCIVVCERSAGNICDAQFLESWVSLNDKHMYSSWWYRQVNGSCQRREQRQRNTCADVYWKLSSPHMSPSDQNNSVGLVRWSRQQFYLAKDFSWYEGAKRTPLGDLLAQGHISVMHQQCEERVHVVYSSKPLVSDLFRKSSHLSMFFFQKKHAR